jgi:MoaA/NifB/PqqE/SkfB family radical SAM enzyme
MKLSLPWRRKVVQEPTPPSPTDLFLEKVRGQHAFGDLVAAARNIGHRTSLEKVLGADRWLDNYLLNIWDQAHQVDVVRSYPWRIALPIADLCNARCTFCNSWLAGKNVLTLGQLERYMEVLPYAREVGIQGHGEPLANPNIGSILKRLAEVVDSRATSYVITNGVFLRRRLDDLLNARVNSFSFSLNAVTNQTHDVVMGLGENALNDVLEAIRELVALKAQRPGIWIAVSMVLNADNFHEAPDFVKLGNDLGIDWIFLRTLAPLESATGTAQGLNYHRLPPVLRSDFQELKERIVEVAAASRVHVDTQPETWDTDVVPTWLRDRLNKEPPKEISRCYQGQSFARGDGRLTPPDTW